MTHNYKLSYAVVDAERETVLSSFPVAEFGATAASFEDKAKAALKAAHKCKDGWLRSDISRQLEVTKIVRRQNGGFDFGGR
jgi:hypothetical protein